MSRVRCSRLCQFYVTSLRIVLFLSKLDDRQRLQHSSCQSSCSTLPRPSQYIPRSVSFRVTVRSHGASDYDDKEKRGDDTGDAVENDHSDRRRGRGSSRRVVPIIGRTHAVSAVIQRALLANAPVVLISGGCEALGSSCKYSVVLGFRSRVYCVGIWYSGSSL